MLLVIKAPPLGLILQFMKKGSFLTQIKGGNLGSSLRECFVRCDARVTLSRDKVTKTLHSIRGDGSVEIETKHKPVRLDH